LKNIGIIIAKIALKFNEPILLVIISLFVLYCSIAWNQFHLLTLENTNSYQILLFMLSFHNSLLPKSLENTTALDIKKL